jgi:hypothetical protein
MSVLEVNIEALENISPRQREALISLHDGGSHSGKNAFLKAACDFYLEPLGISYDYATYDFYSAVESICYPTIKGISFDLKGCLGGGMYEGLFSSFSLAPDGVKLSIREGLPHPEFYLDRTKGRRLSQSLFARQDAADFEESVNAGLIDAVNAELRQAIAILKATLDLGFNMILHTFEGESNAQSFLFDGGDYFRRVKDELIKASKLN